ITATGGALIPPSCRNAGGSSQAIAGWAQIHARSPHNETALMALQAILHLAQDPAGGRRVRRPRAVPTRPEARRAPRARGSLPPVSRASPRRGEGALRSPVMSTWPESAPPEDRVVCALHGGVGEHHSRDRAPAPRRLEAPQLAAQASAFELALDDGAQRADIEGFGKGAGRTLAGGLCGWRPHPMPSALRPSWTISGRISS